MNINTDQSDNDFLGKKNSLVCIMSWEKTIAISESYRNISQVPISIRKIFYILVEYRAVFSSNLLIHVIFWLSSPRIY
jgi:hypothetical protein